MFGGLVEDYLCIDAGYSEFDEFKADFVGEGCIEAGFCDGIAVGVGILLLLGLFVMGKSEGEGED